MKRQFGAPCSNDYFVVNMGARQFFASIVFDAGCDTTPLTGWEAIAAGLLMSIPPVAIPSYPCVGAWAGDPVGVIYASYSCAEASCTVPTLTYEEIPGQYADITDDVLVMMTSVNPQWAVQLAPRLQDVTPFRMSASLEFAYLALNTRDARLWAAMTEKNGADWPQVYTDIVAGLGHFPWAAHLKATVPPPGPLPTSVPDLLPDAFLTTAPLVYAVNLSQGQYIDLPRLSLYCPGEEEPGLNRTGAILFQLIRAQHHGPMHHLPSQWFGDRIAFVYEHSAPDRCHITTTNTNQPARNLFELAREEYRDITDDILIAMMQLRHHAIDAFVEASRHAPPLLYDLGNLVFHHPHRTQELKRVMDALLGGHWTRQYKIAKDTSLF